MSNWEYAQDVPTSPWRSAMSLPRELTLRSTPDGFRLVQQPVRELRKLRGRRHRLRNASVAEANAWLERRAIQSELLELAVEFEPVGNTNNFGLKLRTGENQTLILACDLAQKRVYLDRTHAGRADFHPKFAGTHESPLGVRDGRVQLHAILDASSVEVFLNGGGSVITDLFFPSGTQRHLEVFSLSGLSQPEVRSLDVWELKSAWR
jgi:fructan beta-fructosidase